MKSSPIVLTLDAGGTNFVFSAIQNDKNIIDPIHTPSNAHDLELCLNTILHGFEAAKANLTSEPVAISFAFPGPADYAHGIIGGFLPNFPAFRNDVALGPFLEDKLGIPVFINNDADLYAFGEATVGKLPEINRRLKSLGSSKVYKNLLGYTFGTGFGFGFVSEGHLHTGDNSCIETFCLPHKENANLIAEEGVSARAVRRVYSQLSGDTTSQLEPKDIYDIAEGVKEGNRAAAIAAFEKMGEIAGYAMTMSATLLDGIIVIGGGLIGAKKYIIPALLRELRSSITTLNGETLNRVQMKVYNLDDDCEFEEFAKGQAHEIKIFGTNKTINCDTMKRIGVATSTIGASQAISMGAAQYALSKINCAK